MKKLIFLLPIGLICLTGCDTVNRMNRLMNESTCSIYQNAQAVQQSTAVIQQNQQVINESTRVIEENHRLLKAAASS
jgi:hypothetical protein